MHTLLAGGKTAPGQQRFYLPKTTIKPFATPANSTTKPPISATINAH